MSRIEEIKKILADKQVFIKAYFPTKDALKYQEELAQQIHQLYEPKLSPYSLPSDACDKYFTPPEPDESMLLTDEEQG